MKPDNYQVKVKINGKSFLLKPFDDVRTIIQRYALADPKGIPEFFYFDEAPTELAGADITIKDLRKTYAKIKAADLPGVTRLNGLSAAEGVIVWAKAHDLKPPFSYSLTKIFEGLDRYSFRDAGTSKRTFDEFDKKVERWRTGAKKDLEIRDKTLADFFKVKPAPVEPFEIDGMTVQYRVMWKRQEDHIKIFNFATVSAHVPFIAYRSGNKEFFKVFDGLIPAEEWVEEARANDGIYFKILAVDSTTRHKKIANAYAPVFWGADHTIELSYRLNTKTDVKSNIQRYFFECLDDQVKFKLGPEIQLGIKGAFTAKLNFNKYVFADLVCNSKVSKIAYMNESTMTSTQKATPKFHTYLQTGTSREISTSLAAAFSTSKKKPGYVKIRIGHADDILTARTAQDMVARILAIYEKKHDSIVAAYADVKGASDLMKKVKVRAKKNKRTGQRLGDLQAHNPSLFSEWYSSQCQKKAQPYILKDEKEAKSLREKLKNKDKIMFFEDTWYACEPREEGEPNTWVWPALKKNTDKKSGNPDYKIEHPLLPCCLTTNQYANPNSELSKYLKKSTSKNSDGGSKKGGYVLASRGILDPQQKGSLPHAMEKVMDLVKIKKVSKGKKEVYPYLRMGVSHTQDSFVHCLLAATDPGYFKYSVPKRQEIVDKIKHEWRKGSFAVAKQELFDFSSKAIEAMIKEDYIPPESFVSLGEKYFGINILLIDLSIANPDGDFLPRRTSRAYLPKVISKRKNTVVIIRNQVAIGAYPYQSELMINSESPRPGEGTSALFRDDIFVDRLIELYYECQCSTFSVSSKGAFRYPIEISV